jgi:hypothetical protein
MLGSMQRSTDKCVTPKRMKAAQFTNHTKDSDWETLAQRGRIARLCTLFKVYSGNELGKLYATGCEGLSMWVQMIIFGNVGIGGKERISRI